MAQYVVIYGAGFIGLLSVIASLRGLRQPALSAAPTEPLRVSSLSGDDRARGGAR